MESSELRLVQVSFGPMKPQRKDFAMERLVRCLVLLKSQLTTELLVRRLMELQWFLQLQCVTSSMIRLMIEWKADRQMYCLMLLQSLVLDWRRLAMMEMRRSIRLGHQSRRYLLVRWIQCLSRMKTQFLTAWKFDHRLMDCFLGSIDWRLWMFETRLNCQ